MHAKRMIKEGSIEKYINMYSRAPVSTDSVSAVYRGPKNKWKIQDINGP
jgi:hypothetical protein